MSISLYCSNNSGYRGGDRCHPTATRERGAWQIQEIRAVRAWRLQDTLFPQFDWSACSQCRVGIIIKDVFGTDARQPEVMPLLLLRRFARKFGKNRCPTM